MESHNTSDEAGWLSSDPQLNHMLRLASIGALITSIAHEANNPLNGIINCAEILCSSIAEDDENREFAELIISESARVARIISSMTSFGGEDDYTLAPCALSEIWEQTYQLIGKRLQHSGVILESDIPSDLPYIRGFREQIQQVILTIMMIAENALCERYPHVSSDKILKIQATSIILKEESFLRVAIEDHGMGIAEKILDKDVTQERTMKEFEAFARLGLAASKQIVAEHGGTLKIVALPDGGNRFQIDLPAVIL